MVCVPLLQHLPGVLRQDQVFIGKAWWRCTTAGDWIPAHLTPPLQWQTKTHMHAYVHAHAHTPRTKDWQTHNFYREILPALNFAVMTHWVITQVRWLLWKSCNPTNSQPWRTSRRRSTPSVFYTVNTLWNTEESATAQVVKISFKLLRLQLKRLWSSSAFFWKKKKKKKKKIPSRLELCD